MKYYVLTIQYKGRDRNISKKPYIWDRNKCSECLRIARETQNLTYDQMNILQEKNKLKNGSYHISIEERETIE